MKFVNVHQAKTTLSQLLVEMEHGEEIVIGRNGVAVARLVPVQAVTARQPGLWRKHAGWEHFSYDAAILAPLTDQEMEEEGWP